jgi:hypothetical protein
MEIELDILEELAATIAAGHTQTAVEITAIIEVHLLQVAGPNTVPVPGGVDPLIRVGVAHPEVLDLPAQDLLEEAGLLHQVVDPQEVDEVDKIKNSAK